MLKNYYLILRKATFLRAWNFFLVLLSYLWSKYTQRPVHWGFPVAMSIEPTTSCNLRCPECPSGLRNFTRPTGMLSTTLFNQILNQIHKHTTYLTFYFQGEPFLNKSFLDMVRSASERNLYTITSTNAHYINEQVATEIVQSGLSKLIISLDGTTQQTYMQYRIGGDLDKVIAGTKYIVEAKKRLKSKTPFTEFQFLVVQHNEHQLNDAKQLQLNLGVDNIVFKTAQIYNHTHGSALMPRQNKYNRYKQMTNGEWQIKNKLENHCWKLWNSCVVTWDGKVVPCCFDKDASYEMGNVASTPLPMIWNNTDYKKFRSQVLQARNNIDICSNCSEGSLVYG